MVGRIGFLSRYCIQKNSCYILQPLTMETLNHAGGGFIHFVRMLVDVKEQVLEPMLAEDSKLIHTIVLLIRAHERAQLSFPLDIIHSVHTMLRGNSF